MTEARMLIRQGKGNRFLTAEWFSHAGVLPKSADSYVNIFAENSELSKALPLRNGKDLKLYQSINVPILGVIGDEEEYTVLPIREAMELLKKENPRTELHQLKDCDHIFSGHEVELIQVIRAFVQKHGPTP